MSKVRLTRQELSWLLTQEAQNAAERLRVGVQVLRTHAPPAPEPATLINEDPGHHVDASLDALDDVMKMLSSLNQRQSSSQLAVAPRRGRIDLAALIVEVAPEARVSIEPGSGTEVYGDEADFRRMIQVLIGHGTGEGSAQGRVIVRRDGDDVRISTTLGPDSSPTAGTERAWLSRMALRYGGRHDLEGGNETLVLPAEQSADRSEREALRKELDEARKQGEVYARELAAVFDRGEEVATVSSVPPAPGPPAADRFATITKVCAGVSSELRASLGPLTKELASLRRHEVTDEQLDTLRRRLSHTQELVASLRSIGSLPEHELATEVDLVEIARGAARDGNVFGERNQVKVVVKAPDGQRLYVRCGTKAVGALARELVAHAVAASPRNAVVEISVADDPAGPRLVVDDAGSPLPASARRSFLALETHAGQYARPSGLPIFMAAELAACVGGRLELSDAPARAGDATVGGPAGGGLRVAVTFAKT